MWENKVTDIAKLSNLLKIRNSNHFNTTVHENHIRTWIDIFDPSHSKQLNLNLLKSVAVTQEGGGWIGWGNKTFKSSSRKTACAWWWYLRSSDMHKSVCYVMQNRMIKYKFMHTQIYPGSVTQTYIQSPGYTWDFQSTILV